MVSVPPDTLRSNWLVRAILKLFLHQALAHELSPPGSANEALIALKNDSIRGAGVLVIGDQSE
jgi:hypothetical protein